MAVSSSIMRTLAERGWVRVVGHRDVPGRPAVYATTRAFLDDFGLKTLDELPPTHELKNLDESPFGDPYAEEAPPAAPAEVLAQADAPGPDDEANVSVAADQQHDDTTAGTADETHAGTASDRSGLSFADLEARLAERARTSVAEDGGAGAESIPEERSDDP